MIINTTRTYLLISALALATGCANSDVPIDSPGSPVSGTVLPGSAAPGTVNIETAPVMQVNVTLSSSSTATDVLKLTIREELGNSRVTRSRSGVQGGGVVAFDPIDVTSLDDGVLLLSLELSNAAGSTTFQFPSVLKDTIAPAIPLSAAIVVDPGTGSGSVPADTINLRNHLTTQVEFEFPANSNPKDEVDLTFSDGATSVTTSFPANPGAGLALSPPANLSALADGSVTLQATVTDRANNRVTIDGATALKDTVLAGPTMAYVVENLGNANHVVNRANVDSTIVRVLFPEASLDRDLATVRISDGVTNVTTPTLNPVGGENRLTFSDLDLTSLADGALSLQVTVEDTSGNYVDFLGNAALKDTVLGIASGTRVLAGPDNAANVINAASATSVFVRIDIDASVLATDVIALSVNDGAAPLVFERSGVAGPASVNFAAFDSTTLADGDLVLDVELRDQAGNVQQAAPLVVHKDSAIPTAPAMVDVPTGANNPGGFVNAITQNSVTIQLRVGAGDDPDRSVRLSVRDSGGAEILRNRAAPDANQLLAFSGLDLSGFQAGTITLETTASDTSGNVSTTTLGTAVLDRSIVGPDSALIPAGPDNDQDVISAAIAAAVPFHIAFPAGSVAGDQVDASLSDGAITLDLPLASIPAGGADLIFASVDTTTLNDGVIQLVGSVRDMAGNSIAIGPFPFTKDTMVPGAPIATHVAAGADNGIDTVNLASVAAVKVEVELPATYDGTEQVLVRITDSQGMPVASASLTAPLGGGLLSFVGLDVSGLLDGSLGLLVEVTDPNQNQDSYAGTSALKDTLLPPAPDSSGISAGADNDADTINLASQDAVQVQVSLPASTVGDEQVTVSLRDGANPTVASGALTAPAGGGVLNFSGIDTSSLSDGPISVAVHLVDGAGNEIDNPGTSALKDTMAPVADAAAVLPTVASALDTVTAFEASAVSVEITWGSDVTGLETAIVRFTDGVVTVASAPFSTAQTTVNGFDLSSLADGSLELSVAAVDSAGNATNVIATTVLKRSQRTAARLAFVANAGDDTLSVLHVEDGDGALRSAGYGLTGSEPVALAVRYDSRFVYVANRASNNVSAFSVDPTDGALAALGDTPVGAEAVALAMHPSSDFLFVASRGSNRVDSFRIDSALGTLTPASTSNAGSAPDTLVADPSGRFLYASDPGSNEVWTYQINPVSGALSAGVALALGAAPTGLAAHPSGLYIYVGTDALVTPYAIDASTGALNPMTPIAAGTGAVRPLAGPDGRFLYAASDGDSRLRAFSITAGDLAQAAAPLDLVAIPSNLEIDPSGNVLYLSSAQSGEVQAFDLDLISGAPAPGQRQRVRPGATAIAIGADGSGVQRTSRFLYAVNSFSVTVASYTIDDSTGDLAANGPAAAIGALPQGLAIMPDAAFAFVVSEINETVTRLQLGAVSGQPTVIGAHPVGTRPAGLALDGSGRFLYVSNSLDDTLSMLSVNPLTGDLAQIAAPIATGTLPGTVAGDPTGRFIYVIERTTNSLASYEIDADTGTLSPTSVPSVPSGGLTPASLAVHPSGRFLYVTNGGSTSVMAFDIDAATGNLTPVAATPTGSLPGPVAITPGGEFLLVGNRSSGDISVYEISPANGTPVAVPGSPTTVGTSLGSLSVDPTGRFVHASDSGGPGIATFLLDLSTGTLSAGGVQLAGEQPSGLGATGSIQ